MPLGPVGSEALWLKSCSRCGARMVKVVTDPPPPPAGTRGAEPPAYPVQWWCACGEREPAGTLPVKDPSAEIRAGFAKGKG